MKGLSKGRLSAEGEIRPSISRPFIAFNPSFCYNSFMQFARVHLVVKGRVQGVFYRAFARDIATQLGLKGWVRNLPDGNVEV